MKLLLLCLLLLADFPDPSTATEDQRLKLKVLAFANDVALLSEEEEDLENMTVTLQDTARRIDLDVNVRKTKKMIVSKEIHLQRLLMAREAVYERVDSFKVQVTTWNVHHKKPPDDVRPLLGLDRQPDIVAVGLQEVSVSPHEAILNAIFIDKWTKSMDATIEPAGFTKIRTVAMVGIILNVYARDRHNSKITVLDHARVRVGFKGLWGNKGGVALTILLYGSPVTFVAAHLAHGDENVEQRIEDFQVIEKRRGRSCSSEEYTFWLGDFNFRLNDPDTLTAETIHYKAVKGQYSELLGKDQLNQLRAQGRVFKGYDEQPINFKPTYRYYVGSENFDLARRPAWTDRILYRASSGREISPLHYGVIPDFNLSDHRPVEAFFTISVSMES